MKRKTKSLYRLAAAGALTFLCIRPVFSYYEIADDITVSAPDFTQTEIWSKNPYPQGTDEWLVWGEFYQTYGYLPTFGLASSDLYATDVEGAGLVDALVSRDDNFEKSTSPETGGIGYLKDRLVFIKSIETEDGKKTVHYYEADGTDKKAQEYVSDYDDMTGFSYAVPASALFEGTLTLHPFTDLAPSGTDYGSVQDVKYEIWQNQKKVADASPGQTLTLDKGTYTVKRIGDPKGYEEKEAEFTVQIEAGKNRQIDDEFIPIISTAPKLGALYPAGKATFIGSSLQGAVAQFDYSSGTETRSWTLTSDKSGAFILDPAYDAGSQSDFYMLNDQAVLPSGTVKMTLLSSPPGYRNDDETKSVSLEPGQTDTLVWNVQAVTFSVEVTTPGVSAPLPVAGQNFVLSVHHEGEEDQAIWTKTDDAGRMLFSGLLPGSYTLTMQEPPKGFVLPKTKEWNIAVSDSGEVTLDQKPESSLSITETMLPFSLQIHDLTPGEEVSLSEDKETEAVQTAQKNTLTFDDLIPNTVYVIKRPSPWYSILDATTKVWLEKTAETQAFYINGEKCDENTVQIKNNGDTPCVFLSAVDLENGDYGRPIWISLLIIGLAGLIFLVIWLWKRHKRSVKKDDDML